jgi:hypothetical protein
MTLFVPAEAERSVVSLAEGNLTLNNVLIPVDHAPTRARPSEFARRAEIMGDSNV